MKRRRRESRIDAMTAVRIRCGEEEFNGLCVNIAVGGMFIQSLTRVPFGSKLTVTMKVLGGRAIEIPCMVRWTSSEGFGVQHGSLRVAETKALSDYVASLKPHDDEDAED